MSRYQDQRDLLGRPPTSGATISKCGRFRYVLWRAWGEQEGGGFPARAANFIMLNPSTADATADDPTIRRCVGFARSWGMDGLFVTNLYPLRATDPSELWKAEDRLGEFLPRAGEPVNEQAILAYASISQVVVCAWGSHAKPDRAARVLTILANVKIRTHCLGLTKDGHPRHPLYLGRNTKLREFSR